MATSSLQDAAAFLESYSNAVAAVAGAVSPAIVRVEATQRHRGHRHWGSGRARVGHGSGVVIDAEKGHVLTNFHVTRESDKVAVTFGDGKDVEGDVLGADAVSDLAVVKVPTGGLTGAALGDSDALKVGQVVIALGNPDGNRVVATAGIVSAVGMELRGPSGRVMSGLIQTDALFNPGMSGGALVNARSEVIGINAASIMEAQGINLAIGVNTARKIAAQLIAGGVKRPRLGIAGERARIYEGLIKHHQLQVTHGIAVYGVEEESGAAAGGIQKGDIVIGIDDKPVQGVDDLHRALMGYKVGDEVTVTVIRDLDLLKLKAKLGSEE
ncbi:MAG TPA: trypsin-like peptidase domain-containing protein [Anaerolineae bacterium]